MCEMGNVFVTGTDTDVGKTIVTAIIVNQLKRKGISVIPYKPIQTGAVYDAEELSAPDVAFYKKTNDLEGDVHYCTYLFEKACSPHLAAKLENVHVNLSTIEKELNTLSSNWGNVVIEGAGGIYVPINTAGICMIDLIKQLSIPTIVVGRAGVGTINHTLLTVHTLQGSGISVIGIILNNMDNSEKQIVLDNQQMIEKLCNVPVIGIVPFYGNIVELFRDSSLLQAIIQDWQFERIMEVMLYE